MKKLISLLSLVLMAVTINAQRHEVLSLDLENPVYPDASWFSSPYTTTDGQMVDGMSATEEQVYGFLVDDDVSTYWHSRWEDGSQPNGEHYLRLDLPEDFWQDGKFEQGWGFGFQRRNTLEDHVTRLSIWGIPDYMVAAGGDKSTTMTKDLIMAIGKCIGEIEFPYERTEEWRFSGPITVKDYTSICIFEEDAYSLRGVGRGYWHLAEFRLYGATMTEVDDRDAACEELQLVLEPCLEEIGSDGFESRVGKSRGQYDEDYFEAYETAINAANEIVNVWSVEHDESITIDMINEAKATLEAARDEFHAHVIPATQLDVADGKYMIVSALDFQGQITKTYTAEEAAAANEANLIMDENGQMPGDEGYVPTYDEGYPVSEGDEYQTTGSVIKAIYADGDNAMWKTFQKKATFLFDIQKQSFVSDDTHRLFSGTDESLTYSIRNMFNGMSLGDITTSSQVQFVYAPDSVFAFDVVPNETRTVQINGEDVVCQVVNIRNAGKPADTGTNKLHCNGHGGGSGTNGNVVGWSWESGASQWYLYPVSDEEAESWFNTEENKALQMITEMAAVSPEYVNSMIKIAKDFNTTLDEENRLITSVDQLSSPFTANNDGQGLPALIDGDPSTYWHAAWSYGSSDEFNTTPGTNYFQVRDIDPQYTTIAFSITRRSTQNDHLNKVSVWGYDDDDPTIAKTDGTLLAEFELGFENPGEVKVSPVFNTQGKTILRFYNEESAPQYSNRGYWHAAGFQLFPATQSYYYGSEDKTQYAKRKAEADALVAALETWTASGWTPEMFADSEESADFDELTAQYNALKAAYEAWMAVYADPTELRAAIAEAEENSNMIVIGENPGEWSSENATYKAAIDAAKALDESCMYDGQEATDAVAASIAEAKNSTMGEANQIVAGKWYRIHFGSEAAYDQFGWDKTAAKDWYNASDYHDIKSDDNPDGYNSAKGEGDIKVYDKLFGKYIATGKSDFTYTEDPVLRYNSETGEEYEDSLAVYNASLISDPAEMDINTNIIFTDDESKGGDAGLFRFIEAKTQGDSTLYYMQHKASGLYLSQKGSRFALGITPVLVRPEAMGYGASLITAFQISGERINPLHAERTTNTLVNWTSTNIGSNSMLFIENTDEVGEPNVLDSLSLKVWPGEFNSYVFPCDVTFGDNVEVIDGADFMADDYDENAPKNVVILNKTENRTIAAGSPVIVRTTDEYVNESEALEAYLAERAPEGSGYDSYYGTPCLNKAEIKQYTEEFYAENTKSIKLTAGDGFVSAPQPAQSMLIGSMGTVTPKPEGTTSVLIYDGGTVARGNGSAWSAYIAVPTESIITSARAKWSYSFERTSPNDSVPDMADWNFDWETVFDENKLAYHLDRSHRIAEFVGIDRSYKNSELAIPDSVIFNSRVYKVVSMQDYLYDYENLDDIKSVSLPKNLVNIGDEALYRYTGLSEIDIPASVKKIGRDVFPTENVITLTMHSAEPPVAKFSNYSSNKVIAYVDEAAFEAYNADENWSNCVIVGGDGVAFTTPELTGGDLSATLAGKFDNPHRVNRLKIVGVVDDSDWNTLRSLRNLIEVDLSSSQLTAVPEYAFNGKWAISNILLPEGINKFGSGAFAQTGIKSFNVPVGTKRVAAEMFYNCSNLSEVVLPESLDSIEGSAFSGCKRLTEVNLPSSLTFLGSYAFSECDLTSLEMPNGVKTLGEGVFRQNRNLSSVTLNDGLSEIGYEAFAGTKLTSVVLPSSVTSCGWGVFNSCDGLAEIEVHAVIPPYTEGDIMDYTDKSNITLRVPSVSIGAFRLAECWSEFGNIVGIDGYIPQDMYVTQDFHFVMPEEKAADFSPNIYLQNTTREYRDEQGNYRYQHGNLTVSADNRLNANLFNYVVSDYAKMLLDQNRSYGGYYGNTPHNSTSLIVRGQMRAEDVVMNLILATDRWQFVTFPFDVQVSDIKPVDDNTSWVIRGHNGQARANGNMDNVWYNLSADDVLEAGKGYIMHCYNPANYEMASFTVTPLKSSLNRQLIFSAEDREVELEEMPSEFSHNSSWNFIGNPYPSYYDSRYMDLSAPFIVWNSATQNYEAFSPADDDYILSPGEAFFLQRPVEQPSVTFLAEGRQTNELVRDMDASGARAFDAGVRKVFNFTLGNGESSDRTRVVINPEASALYEVSCDASKFSNSDPTVSQLYTLYGNVKYAINERPMLSGVVNLGVYCSVDGEYSIALGKNSAEGVVLCDHVTGVTVSLSDGESYTFSAKAGTYNDRFTLHFAGEATGIEGVEGNEADVDGYNLGGIRIEKGQKYNGVVIRNGKVTVQK